MAVRVDRHTDEAPRHLTRVCGPRREERRMRTAVSHRNAKALRAADDHISAEFAWRRDQRQREKIGGDGDQHASLMRTRDERRQLMDDASFVWRLHQCAKDPRTELRG